MTNLKGQIALNVEEQQILFRAFLDLQAAKVAAKKAKKARKAALKAIKSLWQAVTE